MSKKHWRLFSLLGIQIGIDPSWLIILVLMTWMLAFFYATVVPELSTVTHWLMGLSTTLTFFACLVLHELGHAVVARLAGMPIHGITLFLFGGVAEIEGEPPTATSEFLMALAGPAVSLLLAIGAALLSLAGWPPTVEIILRHLALANLAVLVFNLVPAFPLDGGRIFRAMLWAGTGNLRRATAVASFAGQGFAWLLIGLGAFLLFTGHFLNGIWLGLVGMFLNNAARNAYLDLLVKQMLQGEPVSRLMTAKPTVVPMGLNLRRWVEDYVYRTPERLFPVCSNEYLTGVITTRSLAPYPQDEWERHSVGEAMKRDIGSITVTPSTDAAVALEKMQTSGTNTLLVVEGDRLVGVANLDDLLHFVELKRELEEGR